jgi:hypothetical protein
MLNSCAHRLEQRLALGRDKLDLLRAPGGGATAQEA